MLRPAARDQHRKAIDAVGYGTIGVMPGSLPWHPGRRNDASQHEPLGTPGHHA